MEGDDFLILDDDANGSVCDVGSSPWLVLVVDDEPDVIAVTRAVLAGCRFEDRSIEVLEAGSAAEARQLLKTCPDVAVALLDVVMETDHAGLQLVSFIPCLSA